MSDPLVIGLVAGESSGDTLGAALLAALRARVGEVRAFGIAGPMMRSAGCAAWADSHELAVMGLIEPLVHLPRLLALRRRLVRDFSAARPHVFVGIDAPAFNIGLEAQLRTRGIPTVQYVSPQVWAWRQGRVRTIAAACDLVLCLFPFESDFYASHGVRAQFVGHPLADQIPLYTDRAAARRALGLTPQATVIALLPGSRLGEVRRLGADFLRAALWLRGQRPEVKFVAPMASPGVRNIFAMQRARVAPDLEVQLFEGQAQPSMIAADAVLVASGTATLETLLVRRPMVAAYRFNALTAFLLRGMGLVKVRHFSQPNLLTGKSLVPEFLQESVNGEDLGRALLQQLDDVPGRAVLEAEFLKVHQQLRVGAAERAAQAILELVHERGTYRA
ncbi:MAG TPA: lipid-A-disaccharide synthase [Steroidobacteraceae bacterium]|jgi:lipid-A-disaccharide synthase|nr:lipid-A-disaccharide synthase [Steroidobacteraceae bacterium]